MILFNQIEIADKPFLHPRELNMQIFLVSYVANDRRVIVGNRSRRKFTKILSIVIADIGDIREPGLILVHHKLN